MLINKRLSTLAGCCEITMNLGNLVILEGDLVYLNCDLCHLHELHDFLSSWSSTKTRIYVTHYLNCDLLFF